MKILNNFFTSGWDIPDDVNDEKSQFQMLNIGLVLSAIGLIFGIVSNYISGNINLIYIEFVLIIINTGMFFILRKNKKYFEYVATILTTQFTVLFLFLMYVSDPSAMKHVWLFTYPIIILYFQGSKKTMIWLFSLLFMIFIAPLQPFFEVHYTLHQVFYIIFVVLIVASIMYFYKIKIDEAKKLIFQQQNQLLNFNAKLALQVEEKTATLSELNESLEIKVEEKIQELIQKDKILTVQSKQAVMGEMISMIAHQWRQPLSTITLYISNLNVRRLLGEEVSEEETYKTLDEISDMSIYLSETIDDFKTFFHPDKVLEEIDVFLLLDRAIVFTLPRLNDTKVKVVVEKDKEIIIKTYSNELVQVILNLLNNAVDILSSIQKQNPKINIKVEAYEDKIFIFIKDNGTGISDDNLPHIFEPYFSTKGKNGTGLGLYMSQMILQKQFHGDINVQTSDKGTTFIVEILKEID